MNRKLSGAITIAVPLCFNVAYLGLGAAFDYPNVLKRPAADVLQFFASRQATVLPLWWLMMLSAAAFIAVAVLLPDRISPPRVAMVGALAGLVQVIGLSRWVFVVPQLAANRDATSAEPIFQMLNLWAGVGIGEWLGYLLTGAWTLMVAGQLWRAERRVLSIFGAISGLGILAGTLEAPGISAAGIIVAIAYLAWSIWLISLGFHLFVTKPTQENQP